MTRGHTTRVIFTVKICIFERSNEKSHFSKTKIYFHKKTAPQLSGHNGLQNMRVGVKTNFELLTPSLVGLLENSDTLQRLILCDDFLQIHFIRGHV